MKHDAYISHIKEILPRDVKIIYIWFDMIVFFDSGKKEFWWLPKFQRISDNILRFGWMFWAIGIINIKRIINP